MGAQFNRRNARGTFNGAHTFEFRKVKSIRGRTKIRTVIRCRGARGTFRSFAVFNK